MSEGKKRRWFQIHLSTAILLMLAASALMWLNLGLGPYGWPVHAYSYDYTYRNGSMNVCGTRKRVHSYIH